MAEYAPSMLLDLSPELFALVTSMSGIPPRRLRHLSKDHRDLFAPGAVARRTLRLPSPKTAAEEAEAFPTQLGVLRRRKTDADLRDLIIGNDRLLGLDDAVLLRDVLPAMTQVTSLVLNRGRQRWGTPPDPLFDQKLDVRMAGLVHLDVSACRIDALDVSGIPALRRLWASGCEELMTLVLPPEPASLEEIVMPGCYEFGIIESSIDQKPVVLGFGQRLTGLRLLDMRDSYMREATCAVLDVLAAAPGLTRLGAKFTECPELDEAVNEGRAFPSVRALDMVARSHDHMDEVAETLFPNLEELNRTSCAAPLAVDLTGLQRLEADWIDVAYLQERGEAELPLGIRRLAVSNIHVRAVLYQDGRYVHDFPYLAALSRLTHLDLNCKGIQRRQGNLHEMQNVQTCPMDISAVAALTALTHLNIAHAIVMVESLTAIERLAALETLLAARMKAFPWQSVGFDLSVISGLTALRTLDVVGVPTPAPASFGADRHIGGLTRLRTLRLSASDGLLRTLASSALAPSITELYVDVYKMDESCMRRLLERLPRLTFLNVRARNGAPATTIQHILRTAAGGGGIRSPAIVRCWRKNDEEDDETDTDSDTEDDTDDDE